eukprot:scaffold182673_cov65-Attheya_sp.AAC.2
MTLKQDRHCFFTIIICEKTNLMLASEAQDGSNQIVKVLKFGFFYEEAAKEDSSSNKAGQDATVDEKSDESKAEEDSSNKAYQDAAG